MINLAQNESIFKAIKRIPVIEIGRHYLGEPERKRWWRCPFHQERTPSFTAYKGRFFCFGCSWRGDATDLIGDMYNLKPIDAAKRIAVDFGLPVSNTGLTPKARKQIAEEKLLQQAFEEWRKKTERGLCLAYRNLKKTLDQEGYFKYPDLTNWEPILENYLNIIQFGRKSEILELWRSGCLEGYDYG